MRTGQRKDLVTASRNDGQAWATFAGRLDWALARLGRGSAARLAERLGVRDATITDWRKGKLSPDLTNVARLLDELRVDAGWLIAGRGVPFPPPPNEAARILEAIRRLVDPVHPGSDEAFRDLAAWMQEALPPRDPEAAAGGSEP